MSGNAVERDYGSFRDPSGYVFYYDNNVFRTVDNETLSLIGQLNGANILRELVDKGFLVPTQILSDKDSVYKELESQLPCEHNFLRHERIPVITYPYEWPFSMLADAAILILNLQLELIEKGYSLKDASAYNIQFVYHKPVFIDVTSIEKPERLDVWNAFGQFCQMFLYPLLLKKYRSFNTKSYYLANINGMAIEEVIRIFGRVGALRPSLLFDIFFQYLVQKVASKEVDRLKRSLAKECSISESQVLNLKRLLRKIEKLSKPTKPAGHWIDYVNEHSYSPASEAEKESYIRNFLSKNSPKTIVDLGANTGQYSLLAEEYGAKVIAVDSDHDSIDRVYKFARDKQASILPLWVDLTNTSPGIGFENRERKGFLERIGGECVFALALIHHLLITSRIPLVRIRDFLYGLTEKYLVIEFIERTDAMFQKMLALRKDIYGDITFQSFVDLFEGKFQLVEQSQIQKTQRRLVTFRKKSW